MLSLIICINEDSYESKNYVIPKKNIHFFTFKKECGMGSFCINLIPEFRLTFYSKLTFVNNKNVKALILKINGIETLFYQEGFCSKQVINIFTNWLQNGKTNLEIHFYSEIIPKNKNWNQKERWKNKK